jgi:D-alanine-D-alanine ligase
VIFPVVHGTNGDDGSLQGYLEMLGVRYVGCAVNGAVAGQDKIFMKQILKQEQVNVTDYTWFFSTDYMNDEEAVLEKIQKVKGPWIVKPASLGSSVGISKADNMEELIEAIEEAMSYDIKVIVESVVENLVEVNCSVYCDFEEQHASVVEEVMGADEFLSFKDKYLGSNDKTGASKGMASTNRIIPARLSYELEHKVKEMAVEAFKVLNASGVSRIDFLINKETEEVFVNEINTIPGSLSFYLWEPVGITFEKLSDELIRLALKRARINERLTFSYDSNILENFEKGSKGAKSKVG